MTHRAESIVAKLLTIVAGLATTSTNAFRGRVRPLQVSEVPAVFVYQGPEEKIADLMQGQTDWMLTVYVEGIVKTSSAQVDTELNKIRNEVTVAIMADYTLGLAYVIDANEVAAGEPDLSGDGDQRSGTQRMTWQIHYRRSRVNPGA